MRYDILAIPVLILGMASMAHAQEHQVYASPDALKWQQGPPGLPKGAEFVILSGDPTATSGTFVLRARMPAGYKIPPHSHPTTEQVTVLSGDFGMGMGETYDEAKGHEIQPGGFASVPARTRHFVWSKSGAVIQVHGQSPFDITYVDPADDPRQQ